MMARHLLAWLAIFLAPLMVIGCGQAGYQAKSTDSMNFESNAPDSQSLAIGGSDSTGEQEGMTGDPNSLDAIANRKIIYTANISVIVDDFSGVESEVKKLVEQFGGYIASANLDRMQREKRTGSWTVRIPISNFDKMLNSVGEIGIPTSRSQNSQDVTEEYVDLTARITNKQKLEERIIQLLERPEDKIQHVIEVEKELARVREDIERMEGRIRFLKDRVDLTTITIMITEEKEYQPPQAPTFSNRIAKAWQLSIDNSRRFFEDSAVFIVANTVPLIACLIAIAAGLFFLRRHLKLRRQRLNA